MSSSPHYTIIPSNSDIKNTFSSMNILNYFLASPRSISPDTSNDFTKYFLDILVFSPLHDDLKMEVIQAYDAIPPPQVVIALPAILPPSLVLSLSPMYIVPTGRIIVPAGRYIVPTGSVIIATGRYIVPAGSDHNSDNVIQNGNSLKITGRGSDGGLIILPPTTAEEHLAVQRESKARTTLLQSIPDDHIADFHYMDDARDIWNAVKARFGGNA
nr:xylulose kinase-1 [Tanacetum cinerariifolium]